MTESEGYIIKEAAGVEPVALLSEASPTPIELEAGQIVRLSEWDSFIDNLKIEKGFTWRQHWEEMSKKEITERNKSLHIS